MQHWLCHYNNLHCYQWQQFWFHDAQGFNVGTDLYMRVFWNICCLIFIINGIKFCWKLKQHHRQQCVSYLQWNSNKLSVSKLWFVFIKQSCMQGLSILYHFSNMISKDQSGESNIALDNVIIEHSWKMHTETFVDIHFHLSICTMLYPCDVLLPPRNPYWIVLPSFESGKDGRHFHWKPHIVILPTI